MQDLAYTLGWSAVHLACIAGAIKQSTTNRYDTMWHWQLQGIMVNLEKTGQLVHVSHLEPVPYLPSEPHGGAWICKDLCCHVRKMKEASA